MAKEQSKPTPLPKEPKVDHTALLREEVEMLTEAIQRERADAMNMRRRHDEQIMNLKSTLKADVVNDLLPVIDNFERALKHVPEELKENDYVKGVQGVVAQFDKTLADMGVKRIQTIGEDFNPHFHEAVGIEDGEGDKEVVSEELQAGYQIGDTVIRHAMVKVTKQ
ncbi:MAG: nucleotide exchange factor GrpE [Candidatus Saccharibacteria bacterium]|nr:nucleotide exchange factor GrpE [Candidatus Saccharibacteria bacterium]